MRLSPDKLTSRFHRRVIDGLMNCHLRALSLVYIKRPVPLKHWRRFYLPFAILSGSPNPLSPNANHIRSGGASLPVHQLNKLLHDDTLGEWSLDGETITCLWEAIQKERPKVVIECGAGLSTLCLCKGIADYRFRSKKVARLISLEQEISVKETVEKRLETSGLGEFATILHVPISKQGDYKFNTNQLREQLGSEEVDWLIIDGPAGPEGCRTSTLPFLSQFCRPGARWFLDDAFRDGEMSMLGQWNSLRGIVVEGIYPIGKGLASGIIEDPNALKTSAIQQEVSLARG